MTDDPALKAVDRRRISLEQPHEVYYWTRRLKITATLLRKLISIFGNSSKTILEIVDRYGLSKKKT